MVSAENSAHLGFTHTQTDLGSLLLGFFRFFGFDFNYHKVPRVACPGKQPECDIVECCLVSHGRVCVV